MSWWKKLFASRAGEAAQAAEPVAYQGFLIRPAPYKEDGQYQTAGFIEKEIGGVRREHRFIRADRFTGYDDAVRFTVVKAQQLIDQQGERLFT